MPDNTGSKAADPRALLLENGNIADFLDQLSVLGEQVFGDDASVACGLMFQRGDRQVSVRSRSLRVLALGELQHTIGEGPALAAITGHEAVVVDDGQHDRRWPRYLGSSAAVGFTSMLSVPLELTTKARATLNFYARPGGYFTPDRQRVAAVFAAQAGTALEMAMRVARYQDAASDWYSAMENHTSIDIAVGIILAQNRCTQGEALEILRQASDTRNQTLDQVARDLLAQVTGTDTRTRPTD